MRRALVSIAMVFALLIGAATAAQAAPMQIGASAPISMAAPASTPWDNDVTSFLDFVGGCAGVGAGGWAAYKAAVPQAGAVILVLATVRCSIGVGATLGEWNVAQICWRSRHWDPSARALVWALTSGKYTRC